MMITIHIDPTVDESSEGCVSGKVVMPEKLLEECWFFGNLLDGKTSPSSTSPDHRTHSSNNAALENNRSLTGKSFEETYESIKKTSRKSLLGGPPLTAGTGAHEFGDDHHEEEEEEEMEFSMGKLIRQASLNNSDTITSSRHAAKGLNASSTSISRMKPEADSLELGKTRPQRLKSNLKTQKSLTAVQSQDLQGFKDSRFDFDCKNSNSGVVISTNNQEEKKKEVAVNKLRRTQSWAPPVPGKKPTEEDIKAQIKFWARAVASNVRQEC